MIEIALSHGFKYTGRCTCAKPGRNYYKGRNKLVIFDDMTSFKLVRIGNVITLGNADALEMTLNNYGL